MLQWELWGHNRQCWTPLPSAACITRVWFVAAKYPHQQKLCLQTITERESRGNKIHCCLSDSPNCFLGSFSPPLFLFVALLWALANNILIQTSHFWTQIPTRRFENCWLGSVKCLQEPRQVCYSSTNTPNQLQRSIRLKSWLILTIA